MLGALIGAGSSLIGGLLGRSDAKDAQKAAARARQQEYLQQKEFAKSGIQWRVKDAQKAGIHPLYAIGANTVSYSPQSIGDPGPSSMDWLGDVGQNIGRAIDATRSNSKKAEALALTASQIQLEGLQLDNDIKRAQLASSMRLVQQAGSAPGLPSTSTREALTGLPGQGDTPQVEGPTINVERTLVPGYDKAPQVSYGVTPEVDLYSTKYGYSPAPPQTLSEVHENNWWLKYQWMRRNLITPEYKPPYELPATHEWQWNPFKSEWEARNKYMGKYWRY